jgi:hypothetical protein
LLHVVPSQDRDAAAGENADGEQRDDAARRRVEPFQPEDRQPQRRAGETDRAADGSLEDQP